MFTTKLSRFWRNRRRYKHKGGSSRLSSMRRKPRALPTVSQRRSARLKVKRKPKKDLFAKKDVSKKKQTPKFDIDISKVKSKYVKQKKD